MKTKTKKTSCPGSCDLPHIILENDWWVGKTCICPVCKRTFKLTKQGTVPRHARRGHREGSGT